MIQIIKQEFSDRVEEINRYYYKKKKDYYQKKFGIVFFIILRTKYDYLPNAAKA